MVIAMACAAAIVCILTMRWKDKGHCPVENGKKIGHSADFNPSPKITKESMSLPNYNVYELQLREKWTWIIIAAFILFVIGMIFYKNVWISFSLATGSFYYPKLKVKSLVRKRKKELQIGFKHMLYALSSSLHAGRSVENAFREAMKDLSYIYPDQTCNILCEMEAINHKVENNIPIVKAIGAFSERAQVADITNFSEVFTICKRTGGDLVEVLRKTSLILGDKMDMEMEIAVMIAHKKFEARAMCVIPFAIIAFLTFGSADYMEPLYTGAGRLIMTFALLFIGLSLWLTYRIMDIQV